MNILEQSEALKGIPEDALMREMQQPTGSMPQFLVLTELKRRKRMRDEYNRRKAQDIPTVAEEVVMGAGMPQEGIMQMSKSMAPKSSIAQNTGQQEATPREPTMGMASGGLLSLAKGDKLGKPVVYNGDTYMVDDKGQVYFNRRRVANRNLRDAVLQKAASDAAGDVDDSPTPQPKTGSQLLDEAQASMTGSQMFSPSNIPSVGDGVIRPPISGFPPPEGSVDLPVFDATTPIKRGRDLDADMGIGFDPMRTPTVSNAILQASMPEQATTASEKPEQLMGQYTIDDAIAAFQERDPSTKPYANRMGEQALLYEALGRDDPTGMASQLAGLTTPFDGNFRKAIKGLTVPEDILAQVTPPEPAAYSDPFLNPSDSTAQLEQATYSDILNPADSGAEMSVQPKETAQATDELMPRAIGTVGFGFDDLTPNDLLRRQEGIDRREKERGERAEAFRREEGRFYPSPKEADFYAMDTVLRNLKKQRAALGEGIMQGRAGPLTGASEEASDPIDFSNITAYPPTLSPMEIAARKNIAEQEATLPERPQSIDATPPGYKSPQERFSDALSKRPRPADKDGTADAETIETETVTQDLPDELRFDPFNNTVEKGADVKPSKGDDIGGGGGASRTTGGTGGTGGSPLRSRIEQLIADREKDREADKWMALAETGLALMASSNPTLGGAIGEAGLVGVGTMRKAKQDYDKDMLELLTIQEDMRQADLDYSASLAAAAARGSVDDYKTSQQVDDLRAMYSLEGKTLNDLTSQLAALDSVDNVTMAPEAKAAEAARLRKRIEEQARKVLAYETRLKQTIGGRINLSD